MKKYIKEIAASIMIIMLIPNLKDKEIIEF